MGRLKHPLVRWVCRGLAGLLAPAVAGAALLPVTTTDDVSAVACTLRDAITAANTDAVSGACAAGAGDDALDLTGLAGSILLGTALPPLTFGSCITGETDRGLDTSAGSGVDPVADGVALQIFNAAGTGDVACLELPAAGWKAKGKATKRTFQYRDEGFARGPCKAMTIKDAKLLKVVCQAKVRPIAYSLDEVAQERVGVRFRSGATEYCTVFGGTVAKDAQGKRFKAKNAPAPAECPAPAAPCP